MRPLLKVDGRWLLILAAFLTGAAILLYRTYAGWGEAPLLGDTDDAMRMVVVRDFLAGQSWYDHLQHRLNTPFGAEIHWSRLVDVPIALLIAVLQPIAGAASGTVAAMIWPLLLLFVLLWLSARFAERLVGPAGVLPAVVVPLLSPAVTVEFTPGRIDHHNIQITLTLALAWASVESLKRPRFAIAAGLVAATALAIGIEALPAIAAAILAFGLAWVFLPQTGQQLRGFGLAFAGGTLAHLAIALPPDRWFEPACDALSLTYAVAAVLVGAAFAALSLLHRPTAWLPRLGLGFGAGLAVIALTLAFFPTCLAGPYAAVDPWLRANWIEAISEAKPWWASLWDLPAYTLAVGIPPVLGLGVVAYRLWVKAEDRAAWLVLAVFLTLATFVMLAQVRGARLATMPAIPAAAWLIVHARTHYLKARSLLTALGLITSWFAFAGVLVVLVTSHAVSLVPGRAQAVLESRGERDACQLPASFAELAAMPPTRIMTPIDLGAHMLLETPHEVVAAPYHRNEAGVRDAFAFFNQPIAEAREIATERGIGLVVICPAMPEMRGMPWAAEDSFVRLAESDALPAWLQPVEVAGPLEVYAVAPAAR
jgi:hypothetical protein